MNAAQAADEERMRYSVEVLGVIPYFDPVPWSTVQQRMHMRTSEGKCSRCKTQAWPCKPVLRQLYAHRKK